VIGNNVTETTGVSVSAGGIVVSCPSNVINNTAVNNNPANLVLNGTGCSDVNNVAP
jgi:hypothetical protein